MPNGPKKSLYIFLTALLGVLMFLMVDRILIFFFLYAIAAGAISLSISYAQFLIVDYFILTIVMMLGAWWGVWLGLYWYQRVYEEQSHQGFIHHLATKYFPGKQHKPYTEGVAELKGRLQSDLDKLDNLIEAETPTFARFQQPAGIKRNVVRRSVPKKLNGLVRTQIKKPSVGNGLKPFRSEVKQQEPLTQEEVQMEE